MSYGLNPEHYPECPLGLRCSDPQDKYSWKSCENRWYCQMVTEPWPIPLTRILLSGDYIRHDVSLWQRPHNFTMTQYRRYMKDYGWAEAIANRLYRWSGTDPYLEVIANTFNRGFAMAVPIDLPRYRRWQQYKRDKQGLWWVALSSPPRLC